MGEYGRWIALGVGAVAISVGSLVAAWSALSQIDETRAVLVRTEAALVTSQAALDTAQRSLEIHLAESRPFLGIRAALRADALTAGVEISNGGRVSARALASDGRLIVNGEPREGLGTHRGFVLAPNGPTTQIAVPLGVADWDRIQRGTWTLGVTKCVLYSSVTESDPRHWEVWMLAQWSAQTGQFETLDAGERRVAPTERECQPRWPEGI